MKNLLTIFLFFLTLSVSGQSPVTPGVISQGGAADTLGMEMITDGSFAIGGTTPWSPGTSWSIASNNATYNDIASGNIVQTDGNMVAAVEISETYRLTFTITSAGNAYIRFANSAQAVIYKDYANYANGSHVVRFTTAADIGVKGISLRATTTSSAAFSITNVSMKKVL